MSEVLRFALAPDVHPDFIPGWHFFLGFLHRKLNIATKMLDFIDFEAQRHALERDEIDMIFASAFETSFLVKDKGFLPLVKPDEMVSEMMVVCLHDSPLTHIESIGAGVRVAYADNPELKQLGLILLEPAGLSAADVVFHTRQNHILAVKQLLLGEADVAFLPTEIFDTLSTPIRNQLKALVSTLKDDVDGLSHILLLSPGFQAYQQQLIELLDNMREQASDRQLLKDMGLKGWHKIEDMDEIEYLIDLVDTLQI